MATNSPVRKTAAALLLAAVGIGLGLACQPPDDDSGGSASCGTPSDCTAENGCQVVDGRQIFRLSADMDMSGDELCASHGLVCTHEDNTGLGPCQDDCMGLPIFDDRHAACSTFHPDDPQTNDFNGWGQSVFCDADEGLACAVDGCHYCDACFVDSLGCHINPANSTEFSEVFVRCDPCDAAD